MSTTQAQSPCAKASSVRGKIISITHPVSSNSSLLGKVLIDGEKEKGTMFDDIFALVQSNTQIFEKQGKDCLPRDFTHLQVGREVQVLVSDIAYKGNPPEVDTVEIVLLPPGA